MVRTLHLLYWLTSTPRWLLCTMTLPYFSPSVILSQSRLSGANSLKASVNRLFLEPSSTFLDCSMPLTVFCLLCLLSHLTTQRLKTKYCPTVSLSVFCQDPTPLRPAVSCCEAWGKEWNLGQHYLSTQSQTLRFIFLTNLSTIKLWAKFPCDSYHHETPGWPHPDSLAKQEGTCDLDNNSAQGKRHYWWKIQSTWDLFIRA